MVVVAVVDVGDDKDDEDDVVVDCAPSYARRPFDITFGDGFFPVLNTPRCKTRPWHGGRYYYSNARGTASVAVIVTIVKLDRPNLIKRSPRLIRYIIDSQ